MSLAAVALHTPDEVRSHARVVNARLIAGRIPSKPQINIEAIMAEISALTVERDKYRSLAAQFQADNISLSTRLGLLHSSDIPAPPAITISRIINATCDYFQMQRCEIISVRRTNEFVRPRQIAMYLCRDLTPNSLPRIGRMFGDRDHTTVLHACNKIASLRQTDQQIDTAVKSISASLLPLVHSLGKPADF